MLNVGKYLYIIITCLEDKNRWWNSLNVILIEFDFINNKKSFTNK